MPDLHLLRDLVGAEWATIPEVLRARAAKTPDAPFVIHGCHIWSYADAWEEASRFAGFLRRNPEPGPRVVSFLSNRPQCLWTWFGTLAAGGLHVSVNRAHRGEVLADMLRRSRASLLVTEAEAWPLLPPLVEAGIGSVLFVDDIPPDARSSELETLAWEEVEQATASSPVMSDPGAAATVLFTSGTTGRSKAVLLPHAMYTRGAAHVAAAFGFGCADVFHVWLPLAHIAGQLHYTMSAVMAGAALALYTNFSRTRFWEEVAQSGATVFGGLSNVLAMLMMAPERPDDADNSLRLGMIGHPPPELQSAFERRFGVTILDTYGMTECEPLTLPVPPPSARSGSCGLPGPDYELAVHDPEDRPVPPGTLGRIVVRPRVPGVMMQRYEGDDAATVAAWRNLWFHTQDLGRIDAEGFVYFVERLKDSIRRGGENISTAEVEQTLRLHPDVEDCAVVGVADALVGEEVKAAIVLRPGRTADAATIHAFAGNRMASFMVPRYIAFLEALPYSEIGKVRREDLRRLDPGTWDAKSPPAPGF